MAANQLMAAVEAAGNSFNPAAQHALYEQYAAVWRLYLDLLELDQKKLEGLLERHEGEGEARFAARKKLVAVFNLVPTVIRMLDQYLFATAPVYDVGKDADLAAFVADCDGNGTRLADFVRGQVLPLASVLGFVDVLVQNPAEVPAVDTVAAARAAGMRPRVHLVTPLERINWSANPAGTYNWVCVLDAVPDDDDPLRRGVQPKQAYITLSAARPQTSGDAARGFWVRSWAAAGTGTVDAKRWQHEADFVPTRRVPMASLYYQRSVDPERRHWGISKIAMIAVLTKLMVQVLSWTKEDVLANLALMALPSPNGKAPTDAEGNPVTPTLTPFTILWYDPDNSGQPKVLQGSVDHIKIKMELVAALVQEVLREANLLGASGQAEAVTSGVQGMVMRNELSKELAGLAQGLDGFVLELLALAKSWAANTDVTREALVGEGDTPAVAVSHFKGPFTFDPLLDLLKASEQVVRMFGTVSPTMVEAALKMVARAYLPVEHPSLPRVEQDVATNTGKDLETLAATMDALMGAAQNKATLAKPVEGMPSNAAGAPT